MITYLFYWGGAVYFLLSLFSWIDRRHEGWEALAKILLGFCIMCLSIMLYQRSILIS